VGYAEHVGSLLVAEGIENRAELRTLLELGVPLAQGFYLGRPATPWPRLELGVAKGLPVQAPESAPAAVRAPAGRSPAGVGTLI